MKSAQLVGWVKKNPLSVGCGVASVILAVAIFLRSGAIDDATAELELKSTQAQRYSTNVANAAQLKNQYDAIAAATKAIDERLVRAGEIGINQQYFYKLESEFGVKLTSVHQNESTKPKDKYAPVGFSLSVQGEFPAVLGFLQAVEHGARYCRMLSASCSGGRKGPVVLELNFEFLGEP